MSEPWEDFEPSGTATAEAGPWEDFTPQSKPWEDAAAEQNKGFHVSPADPGSKPLAPFDAAVEVAQLPGRTGAKALVRAASGGGLLFDPEKIDPEKSVFGIDPANVPPGSAIPALPGMPPGIITSALAKTGSGLLQFGTSPHGATEMAAAPVTGGLMAAKWAVDMMHGISKAVPEAWKAFQRGDMQGVADSLAAAGAMGAGLGHMTVPILRELKTNGVVPRGTPPGAPGAAPGVSEPPPVPPRPVAPAQQAPSPTVEATPDLAKDLFDAMTRGQIEREAVPAEPAPIKPAVQERLTGARLADASMRVGELKTVDELRKLRDEWDASPDDPRQRHMLELIEQRIKDIQDERGRQLTAHVEPSRPATAPEPETPEATKARTIKERIKAGIDPENVQISVSNDPEHPQFGYVQVDEIHPEAGNVFSSNPTQLRSLGMDIPTEAELRKLPTGRYSLPEARRLLQSPTPSLEARPAEAAPLPVNTQPSPVPRVEPETKPATPLTSTKEIARQWNSLSQQLDRSEIDQMIGEAFGGQLSEDGNKIIVEDKRGGGGKWTQTKGEFLAWLHSKDADALSSDAEWVSLIKKARDAIAPEVPTVETKPATPAESTKPAEPVAETKQPWQMTRDEFSKQSEPNYPETYKIELDAVAHGQKPAHYGFYPLNQSWSADVMAIARKLGLHIERGPRKNDYIITPNTDSGKSRAKTIYAHAAGAVRDPSLLDDVKWHDSFSKLLGYGPEFEGRIQAISGPTALENKRLHRYYVWKAIREGEPVPPEVLADYPDLKPETKPSQKPKEPAPAAVPETPEPLPVPEPSPGGTAVPVAVRQLRTPERLRNRQDELDSAAMDLYGKPYDELPAELQGNVQVTVEHEIPDLQGREPPSEPVGREPLYGREQLPGPAPRPYKPPRQLPPFRASSERAKLSHSDQRLLIELDQSREAAKTALRLIERRTRFFPDKLGGSIGRRTGPEASAQYERSYLHTITRAIERVERGMDLQQIVDDYKEADAAYKERYHPDLPPSVSANKTQLLRRRALDGQVDAIQAITDAISRSETDLPLTERKGIGGAMQRAVERGGEAGAVRIPTKQEILDAMGDLPDRFRSAVHWSRMKGRGITDRIKRSGIYDFVSSSKDSADNRATIIANSAGNSVRHALNRAFGVAPKAVLKTRNPQREMGLTMVVEAGGDRVKLAEMRNTLTGADLEGMSRIWKKTALRAIDFADAHWDKLKPVADMYQKITDWENRFENANGIPTLYRQGGYVFHAQDVETGMGRESTGPATDTGGAPAPFRHVRDHQTYADSIAAGVVPDSINAVDLLNKRIALGQRVVNYGEWRDALRSVVDPATEQPLVVDPIVRKRADGTQDVTAPPGYQLVDFGNRKIALHNGYTGLFLDLTAKSHIPADLMKGMSASKHWQLLVDTYHLGRLAFWNSTSRLGLPGYARGHLLLENSVNEIQKMVQLKEVPAEMGRNLIESKQLLDEGLRSGLNVGNVGDNMYRDWIQGIPVVGTFNKWLFNKYQRGAMAEVYLIERQRMAKMYPELSRQELSRRVAKFVNTRFGNIQSQGWIKSRTGQDLARIVFLAPQWNETLIRSELGAVKDIVGGVYSSVKNRRLQMGPMGRAVGTAALGMFIANQLINYATRGKPTWENEEETPGAKLSAWVPDWIGGGPGFFLHPLAIPAEIVKHIQQGTARTGNWDDAVSEFLGGRFSSLMRGAYTFAANKTPMGVELKPGHRTAGAVGEALPMPIVGNALYRGVAQMVTGEHREAFPGQFQKQIMQSAGIKSEGVPDPGRRIGVLVSKFELARGIPMKPSHEESVYRNLTTALRVHNMAAANEALGEILKVVKANGETRELRDVIDYYRAWVRRPFTGSKALERQFVDGLNAAQKEVYDRARDNRERIAQQAFDIIDAHQP